MTHYMCDGKTRAHYSHFRTIQELLGHKDVSTMMIYTHVLNRGGRGVEWTAREPALTMHRALNILRADSRIDCGGRSLSKYPKHDQTLNKYWI